MAFETLEPVSPCPLETLSCQMFLRTAASQLGFALSEVKGRREALAIAVSQSIQCSSVFVVTSIQERPLRGLLNLACPGSSSTKDSSGTSAMSRY